MRGSNSDGPWNPKEPVQVTPEEYERQVLEWLRASKGNQSDPHVGHLEKITGPGGEYEFDVVARFRSFGGAEFVVLVECKRHGRAVERELVLALPAKLNDVGAHKGMMFSTGGFQKGAIEYAAAHGIALLTFSDGCATYETRHHGPPIEPPPWARQHRFVAHRLSLGERGSGCIAWTAETCKPWTSSWPTPDTATPRSVVLPEGGPRRCLERRQRRPKWSIPQINPP
jgi:restriction system protein